MEGDLLSLKWNNHKATFLHVIESLRNKASFADATIACNEQFFPVHKFVLSACSEYFNAIFEQISCKNPIIILKDIDCKNLKYLLDYMYIGEVNVKKNELASLVGTAECLRIKGLAVPDEDSVSNKRLFYDYDESLKSPAKKKRTNKNNLKSAANRPNLEKTEEVAFSLSESCFENTVFVDSVSNPIKCELPDYEIIEEDPISDSDNSLPLNIDNNENVRNCGSEHELIKGEYDELIAKDELEDPSSDVLNNPGPSSIYDDDLSQPVVETSPSKCLDDSATNWNKDKEWPIYHSHYTDIPLSASSAIVNLNSKISKKKCEKKLCNKSQVQIRRLYDSSYICQHCPYTNKAKANVRRHMMTHTGEKPFKCSYCDYRSVAYHTIKRHLRVHFK